MVYAGLVAWDSGGAALLEELLKVDLGSFVPVTAQLGEQIKHLIARGALAPGEQLPSVRDLAARLGINRNTVAKLIEDLEREGFVRTHRGKGIYVADLPPVRRRGPDVSEFLEATLAQAEALGLGPQALAVALLARAQDAPSLASTTPGFSAGEAAAALEVVAPPAPPPPGPVVRSRPRLLLVECNQPQLDLFRSDVEDLLAVDVDAVLIDDLKRWRLRSTGANHLRPDLCRAAITTFHHTHEVTSLLAGSGLRLVPILSEVHPETLRRLAALPPGTVVGVACVNWPGAGGLRAALENAGLRQLQVIQASIAVQPSLKSMFERARVVVCSSRAFLELEAYAREHGHGRVELWVEDRRLDPGSLLDLARELSLPLHT